MPINIPVPAEIKRPAPGTVNSPSPVRVRRAQSALSPDYGTETTLPTVTADLGAYGSPVRLLAGEGALRQGARLTGAGGQPLPASALAEMRERFRAQAATFTALTIALDEIDAGELAAHHARKRDEFDTARERERDREEQEARKDRFVLVETLEGWYVADLSAYITYAFRLRAEALAALDELRAARHLGDTAVSASAFRRLFPPGPVAAYSRYHNINDERLALRSWAACYPGERGRWGEIARRVLEASK